MGGLQVHSAVDRLVVVVAACWTLGMAVTKVSVILAIGVVWLVARDGRYIALACYDERNDRKQGCCDRISTFPVSGRVGIISESLEKRVHQKRDLHTARN